ncbi:MAG TPA: acyltransferase [Candidatus Limnocylindria bacterium]|nr:acyltransferase [Candidatus Limnocylindria bacterium]
MTATPVATVGRIPSLDGLRAVSITAVVLGHLGGTQGFPAALTAIISNDYVDLAGIGVRVFFVISGFLITRLLVQEVERHGRVSLRRFYLRRVMRIFPAYYAFIAGLCALAAAGLVQLTGSDLLHALTYTVNYDGGRSWSVGHLWSLAVEEQFYLLWPVALVAVGVRRAPAVALAVLVLVPVIRTVEYLFLRNDVIGNSFQTTADALAVGCLFALGEHTLLRRPQVTAIVDRGWVIVGMLIAGVGLSVLSITAMAAGLSLTQFAIGFGVLHLVRHPRSPFGRLLNWRPIAFVGVLSYSIYLWQQVFLNRSSSAEFNAFPLNIVLALSVAVASYFLVERPVLRLRPAVEARLFGTQPAHPTAGAPGSGPSSAGVPPVAAGEAGEELARSELRQPEGGGPA